MTQCVSVNPFLNKSVAAPNSHIAGQQPPVPRFGEHHIGDDADGGYLIDGHSIEPCEEVVEEWYVGRAGQKNCQVAEQHKEADAS